MKPAQNQSGRAPPPVMSRRAATPLLATVHACACISVMLFFGEQIRPDRTAQHLNARQRGEGSADLQHHGGFCHLSGAMASWLFLSS